MTKYQIAQERPDGKRRLTTLICEDDREAERLLVGLNKAETSGLQWKAEKVPTTKPPTKGEG